MAKVASLTANWLVPLRRKWSGSIAVQINSTLILIITAYETSALQASLRVSCLHWLT